ncbi:MAG TPA: DNA translocase FtsK 4TM domain-containing protein, partial [Chitinophagaceae bacterium]|nr:DNA translocase FtsK 4TM domain-containing protein [Chitinophagaceae bacterium]
MANKLKSRKTQPAPEPDKLKPEKEETVQVKQLVKDERTHKIAGALLIALGVFLFIAFVSYLFTWQEDQDKVFRGGAAFLFSDDIKVANLLGRLGAWASHFFIYNGFGLASFLLCSLFFVIGMNLMFKKKLFSVSRNLRYVLVGLPFFSIVFSFLLPANDFPWGGAVGDLSSNWLVNFLGWTGTAVLLSVAGLAYFIWRFNPVFSLPAKKPKAEITEPVAAEEPVAEPAPVVVPEKNYLKGEGGIVVIPPANDNGKQVLNDFKVIEKEVSQPEVKLPLTPEPISPVVIDEIPEPPVEDIIVAKPSKTAKQSIPDLELEIKPVHDETEEPEDEEVTAVEEQPPYEPTLDLRDYKYPTLDLLENHGSDKIVQDAAELEANKN